MLYDTHPYGHLPIGSEASLQAMDRDQAAAFHARMYQPSRATVILAGDAPHAELRDLGARAFGGWSPIGTEPPPVDVSARPPAPPPDARLGLLHRPGSAQSELRIGHVAVSRSTPDYHALVVMNMVLGGQFVSRLNMNLREAKGYTYGVRTGFEFRKGPGPFVLQASVQSEATVDAVRESLLELQGIRGPRPVTPQELTTGRAALTRGYPRNFETAEQIARAAAQLAIYGLPEDYFDTYVTKVLAVDEEAATAAAERHLDPARVGAVIVGDADRIGAGLPELGLGQPRQLSRSE
jgi:predicted Zn-dependent peptidase